MLVASSHPAFSSSAKEAGHAPRCSPLRQGCTGSRKGSWHPCLYMMSVQPFQNVFGPCQVMHGMNRHTSSYPAFVQCRELLVQCMQLLDHPVAAHLASSRSFASAVPYCTDLHAGVIMCQEAQQLAHCSSLVITRIQLHHDLASDVAFRIKEPDFHLHMFIHQTDASDNQDLDAKHARQQWDACLECCLLIKLELVAPLT